jgi:hypothetical protein
MLALMMTTMTATAATMCRTKAPARGGDEVCLALERTDCMDFDSVFDTFARAADNNSGVIFFPKYVSAVSLSAALRADAFDSIKRNESELPQVAPKHELSMPYVLPSFAPAHLLTNAVRSSPELPASPLASSTSVDSLDCALVAALVRSPPTYPGFECITRDHLRPEVIEVEVEVEATVAKAEDEDDIEATADVLAELFGAPATPELGSLSASPSSPMLGAAFPSPAAPAIVVTSASAFSLADLLVHDLADADELFEAGSRPATPALTLVADPDSDSDYSDSDYSDAETAVGGDELAEADIKVGPTAAAAARGDIKVTAAPAALAGVVDDVWRVEYVRAPDADAPVSALPAAALVELANAKPRTLRSLKVVRRALRRVVPF